MDILKWHNKYSTDLELKYNSESTLRMYKHNVFKFLTHFKDEKEPKAIPTQAIKEYLLTFTTLNTRKQNLCAVKRFYQLTVKMPNKVQKIPYPRKVKTLPRVIDGEFLKETILKIKNLKHKAILSLAFSCSLRVSEVVNLKMTCIDRKRMQILIENSKGNKDRYVKLSDSLLIIIEDYAKAFKPQTYLFNGQSKLQYTKSSCNKIVKHYLGCNYHFHTLRHSGATTMLDNGTDLATIQKILGHNNIKTTMTYVHVSKKTIQNSYSPI